MPYKEVKVEKMFFTIGEVAKTVGESTSLIRFWANRFEDLIRPHKNKKGNRMFTPNDVENIKLIHHLVKEKGLTLDGAHKRMKENKTGEDCSLEVVHALEDIKAELLSVKELL
ncbi:MAG: MerR family transcriptional regulator [Prevotellaceae bacterium]|jgi:DNA-binding transcriptional MerR regulator|nr:MerR family transcriptional regulator [Prevotellaceae bacterium]